MALVKISTSDSTGPTLSNASVFHINGNPNDNRMENLTWVDIRGHVGLGPGKPQNKLYVKKTKIKKYSIWNTVHRLCAPPGDYIKDLLKPFSENLFKGLMDFPEKDSKGCGASGKTVIGYTTTCTSIGLEIEDTWLNDMKKFFDEDYICVKKTKIRRY